MSYWSGFRARLLNKILILAFVVILFLWILGRVEFHGLPNLSEGSQVSKKKKEKKQKKEKERREKGR